MLLPLLLLLRYKKPNYAAGGQMAQAPQPAMAMAD